MCTKHGAVDEGFVIGIDLGSSSVKVSVINACTLEVADQYTKPTNCDVFADVVGGHEQDVFKIISCINICVSRIPECIRRRVKKIGVCGQMHGVLFWKADGEKPWKFQEKSYRLDEHKVSNLISWQDARCDQAFLATLPVPDSHLSVSKGFGIPTIFWLKKNKPAFLRKYNRSGLVSSFLVAMLCNDETVYTSYQNAASWGYFNCRECQWNLKLLEKAEFPINLLPRVKPSGELAGKLAKSWYDIPEGIPIGVDLGDLQCSVISTYCSDSDAVINFSTACQIAFLVNNFTPPERPSTIAPCTFWPYFDNQYIAVAASLNGGNILAFFVEMLERWISDMGEVPLKIDIWERLISLGSNDSTTTKLDIKPTCLGERFDPELLASVSNVTGTNVSLGHVFKSLCVGLIENLESMLPKQVLRDAKITRILGNGLGLYRNKILQREVERIYGLPLAFEDECDASIGAAIAIHRYLLTSDHRNTYRESVLSGCSN